MWRARTELPNEKDSDGGKEEKTLKCYSISKHVDFVRYIQCNNHVENREGEKARGGQSRENWP